MDTEKLDVPLPIDITSKRPIPYFAYVVSCLLPKWRIHIQKSQSNILSMEGHECITVGSKSENLDITSEYYHRLLEGQPALLLRSDDDVLVSYQIPCTTGPDTVHGCQITPDTTATKPGYLRLEHVSPENQGQSCHIAAEYSQKVEDPITGTTRTFVDLSGKKQVLAEWIQRDTLSRYKSLDNLEITQSGPAVTLDHISVARLQDNLEYVLSHDYTLAVRYRSWPEEAAEWSLRARPANWPPAALLQSIRSEGCYLVQVPHMHSSNPSIEWRFSFTKGEQKLAHSLSEAQRRCYIAFKTVVTNTLRPCKVVSSYCLKNILFWSLEQIPASVWEDTLTGLGIGFLILVERLIHCLAEHNIPHYFIKDNNLIGHKSRDSVAYTLRRVLKLRRRPVEEVLKFDYIHRLSSSIIEPLSEVLEDIITVGDEWAQHPLTLREFTKAVLSSIHRRLCFIAMDSWDNDFSEAMTEAETIQPGFFTDYIKEFPSNAVVTAADYEDEFDAKARYITGVPWGCFNHTWRTRSRAETDKLANDIEHMFELAIERVKTFDDKYHLAHVSARFLLFLQCFGKYKEAIDLGEQILSTICLEVRWFVCISNQASKVFDDTFQEALGQTPFTALTVTTLICHVLIGCHLSLGMLNDAKEWILPIFEEHCHAYFTADRSQTKVTAAYLYYLLGRSLERLGMYERAKEKYDFILRNRGSTADDWEVKLKRRIEHCQHAIMGKPVQKDLCTVC